MSGYKLHYGTAPNTYSNSIDVGIATESGGAVTYLLTGLTQGKTYFIVVAAYDPSNVESSYSNEVQAVAR
jgi:hypothetical protein